MTRKLNVSTMDPNVDCHFLKLKENFCFDLYRQMEISHVHFIQVTDKYCPSGASNIIVPVCLS